MSMLELKNKLLKGPFHCFLSLNVLEHGHCSSRS